MIPLLDDIARAALATVRDVAPILVILVGFQVLILRRPFPQPRRSLVGFAYVLAGLTLFLVGLEVALFPLGETMARQLTAATSLADAGAVPDWRDFGWVYAFGAAIGFATTVAEPALIAVCLKAEEISGGALSAWGLRIAVAVGVSFGVALGTFRIVSGMPLPYFIMAGYVVVIVLTWRVVKTIVPIAYDSGGVTTSTVTVPVVTALGLGLASAIPGRNPLIEGFGLIAFASLFPIVSVLGYAQLSALVARRNSRKEKA